MSDPSNNNHGQCDRDGVSQAIRGQTPDRGRTQAPSVRVSAARLLTSLPRNSGCVARYFSAPAPRTHAAFELALKHPFFWSDEKSLNFWLRWATR